MIAGGVEDREGSLKALFEYDDDMVMVSAVLVLFFRDFAPRVVADRFKVIDDGLSVDIPENLSVGEEEPLSVCTSHPHGIKILPWGLAHQLTSFI